MDGDEFTRRYQLLKKLVEGTVTTYLARASSGDRVMTHFLQGSHAAQLLDRLDTLPEERRRLVRTVTDLDGTPVVVTDYLDDFDSFRSWASGSDSDASAGAALTPDFAGGEDQAPETGGSEPAESDEPGEFTRMFEAPGDDVEAASGGVERSDAEGAPEASESATTPSEPGSDEPGEFTLLFEAPAAGKGSEEDGSARAEDGSAAPEGGSVPPDAAEPTPDAVEPTPDAGEPGPGERDRPRAVDAEAPGDAAPSGDRPFLFRSPVQGEASGETAEPAASGGEEPSGMDRTPGTDRSSDEAERSEADEEAPGADEPGELTRMLRAESESESSSGDPDSAIESAPEDVSTRPEDEAGSPGGGDPRPSDRASAADRLPDERASDEPGEFTRQFGSAGDRDDVEPPSRGGATGEGSATDAFRSPDTPAAGRADAGDPGAGSGGAAEERDREPGDFTRMFGSRGEPPGGSPDAGSLGVGDSTPGSTSDDDPDDYLRKLGAEPPPSSSGPGRGAATGAGGPTKPPSGNPSPEEGGVDHSRGGSDLTGRGPSDYTRIVRGRGPQGAGASAGAAPTPAAPPPQEEETRHWPYLAALGGIFLVAIVLLVVFLLTGGGDEAAPAEGAGEGEPAAEEVVSPPGEEG